MKFIELEEKINQIAVEKGYTKKENQTYYSSLVNNIQNIVYNILKKEFPRTYLTSFYVSTYKGYVTLKFINYITVKIKIVKIKGDRKFNYGFEQYYYLKNVNIDIDDKNKTIESYRKKGMELSKQQIENKQKEIDTFLNFLKNKNITIEEFDKYSSFYKNNLYSINKRLENIE